MKYKNNVIYIAKCKKDDEVCGVKKGQYYRCIKKKNVLGDKIWWHTFHDKDYKEGFSWSWGIWMEIFEKPIKVLEPKDFVRGESYLCIEDFVMNGGEIDFTKGNFYRVHDINTAGVVFFDDSGSKHYMNDDLSYFVKPPHKSYKETIEIKNLSSIWSTYANTVESLMAKMISSEWVKYLPKELPSWHFRDDEINWENLENDLMQDNIPLAVIESKDDSYVVGIENSAFDWYDIFKGYVSFSDSYPGEDHGYYLYSAYKIKPDKIQAVKFLCKEYSKKYKEYVKGVHEKCIDRDREKNNPKKYEVYTY